MKMKINAFALGLLLAFSSLAHAQINLKSLENEADSVVKSESYGPLLTKLGSAIKPTATTPEFSTKKTSWLASAKKAVTAAEASKLLSELVAGMKSTAFTSAWSTVKDKWFSSAKTTTTTGGLKSLASQLTQNLNTSSFNSTTEKSEVESLISALK